MDDTLTMGAPNGAANCIPDDFLCFFGQRKRTAAHRVRPPNPSTQSLRLRLHSAVALLVDGARLTRPTIDHGVGVTHRPLKVAQVDSDYFDEVP